MSFAETSDWRDRIGFINNLKLDYDNVNEKIVIRKGGLIYGFYDNDETYGWLLDQDISLDINVDANVNYIVMSKNGTFDLIVGNINSIHGLGANINSIPWYTFNNEALIGKVFCRMGLVVGFIVCDDPYWCEYEQQWIGET
jgi:hypothetical protein